MRLLIVESPTKIKTLKKFLGKGWKFAATRGHIYDLPKKVMGIDEDYSPEWVVTDPKSVAYLKKQAQSCETIYISSDPDREGEAIAWQVEELVLKNHPGTRRIRLEGLTRENLNRQLDSPGELDRDMVSAQWSRRMLDRLAGYKISSFLISAFKGKRLSAGRVQSAVLELIVKRWEESEKFESEEFFRLLLSLQPEDGEIKQAVEAELISFRDKPIGTGDSQQLLKERKVIDKLAAEIRQSGVSLVDRKLEKIETSPAFPFNSSELLRRASSWFNWPSLKTMKVAQSLYEKGLITYHRSDSTRLSREGCKQAAAYITDKYGKEYHQWRQGGGGDQEGHEAIRPQYAGLEPEALHSVSSAQRTLYRAIWQRYIQSQMISARWRKLSLTVQPNSAEKARFLGTARTIEEPGFYRCYPADKKAPPEKALSREDFKKISAGPVQLENLEVRESKTAGPRLFTEGSLIQKMKQEGIGRPSTYASTVDRLCRREYIKTDEKKVLPTGRGIDVARFIRRAVPRISDVKLTRRMEKQLDKIACGELGWKNFIAKFDEQLDSWLQAGAKLSPEGSAEGEKKQLDFADCPRCGGKLVLRKGRYGKFVHCISDECEFSSNPPAKSYRCPECGKHMARSNQKKSAVYRCLNHPQCKGKRPVGKPRVDYRELQAEIGECPECGELLERRRGRYGYFWGCSRYPECSGTRPEK